MGLLEKMAARRGVKQWSEPPFWELPEAMWPGWSQSWPANEEKIPCDYLSYVEHLFKCSPAVFACIRFRMAVLSEARLQWRPKRSIQSADFFGTSELALLEEPWPNASTSDLLARMELTASLAGNYYATVADDQGRLGRAARGNRRIVNMRPDWTTIVIDSASGNPYALDAQVVGYLYSPLNAGTGYTPAEPVTLMPDEVVHFVPIQDPAARFRGMSWLTPILSEVRADKAATRHKGRFFENGASPSMVVTLSESVSPAQFEEYVAKFKAAHAGADNAYKCLHPDTDVAMWDGRRVPARDVAAGDLVVAWSQDGKPVPGTVSAAEWQPPSPIVTVTTQRGRVIRTNDRHPFRVGDQWIDAADLRPGALLTTGLGWGDGGAVPFVGTRDAWVLGALTGDGCMVSSTPVVSAWDEGVRTRLSSAYRLNWTGKGHDYRILGVTKLARLAGLTGKRSWEKRIPDDIMCGTVAERVAFISGLIDTDGHLSNPATRRSMELGITSVSRDLLVDAQHLLASLGINSSVSCSMPARGTRTRDAWRLCAFGNEQARRLAALLDLASASKSERLAEYAATPMAKQQDRARFDRVVSVEISEPEPTIGIEVAEHHTHITGGVVTHNTLFLAGGADARTLGANFQQMDFKPLQEMSETRIAMAAGIHPTVVGMSSGLQGSSLNQGNFDAAARLAANGTLRPWWKNAAESLRTLVTAPGGAELWYDDRDIAFLREDATNSAAIRAQNASALSTLINCGWIPDAAVEYIQTNDLNRLKGKHSGMVSVQLLPPGSVQQRPGATSNGSTNGSAQAALTG